MTPEQRATAIQQVAAARREEGAGDVPSTQEQLEAVFQTYAAALGLPHQPEHLEQLRPGLADAVGGLLMKRLFGRQVGAVEPTELKTVWLALTAPARDGGPSLVHRLGLAGPRDILDRVPGISPNSQYELTHEAIIYDWRIRTGECDDPLIPADLPSPKRGVCPSCEQPVALNAKSCRLCGEWEFLAVGPVMKQMGCGHCQGDGLSRDRSRNYCAECNGHGRRVKFYVFDMRNGQYVERPGMLLDKRDDQDTDYRKYSRRIYGAGWHPPGPPIPKGYKKRWFGLF